MSETPWLKRPHPGKGPPMPASVNIEILEAKIEEARRMGIQTPAQTYLQVNKPVVALDEWGQPLPLSSMQQDYLDRVFAVLVSPMERGRALLHSGRLCPDEVEPLVTVYFEIWQTLVEQATADMLANPPPYPAWAEATLGVLFQKPASAMYNPTPEKTIGSPPRGQVKAPEGTQADRRELAVREQR
jgi:hypothetical protein